MPGENIQDWSVTAANNGNADTSINWAEGQPRATVNNSARSMLAAHAKDRNLKNGSIVTGGAVNALTFTSGVGYIAPIPTGLRVTLKIGAGLTSTGATTLNMDGIGATAIKDQKGADLGASALTANTYADLLYNGTNWILLGTGLTAPTAPPGDSTTSIATTQFVTSAIAAASAFNVRVFTASGTYPVTTATTKVLLYIKGGGGGGGGASVNGPRGGGGGEGAETWALTPAVNISGATITVGGGGLNGPDGAAGTTSVVAGTWNAPGGQGGTRGNFGGAGGAGGAAGNAAGTGYSMPGAPGQFGSDIFGNAAFFACGGGKGGGTPGVSGAANSGGGGGNGSNSAAAGAGGSGIVVCFEYGPI